MLPLVQSAATLVLMSLVLQDMRTRRLSNRTVLAFAMLYFVAAALAREGFVQLAAHAATAAAMLLLFAGLHRAGWIGGGDVKLAAAVFLWAGPALAFPVLTLVGASGGACGLAVLASVAWQRRRIAPARALETRGVPYGIALALGGMLAVWAPFPDAVSLT
ncbi:prepilin peptidase [Burkholderia cenocepacia]|uniref:A24 family peptidase n=1 Tax=Burkholderia cepacia complex TaxID=87882 RepID=UPI0004898FC2|nr:MULTISPECIES: prepilin peptidase [Burkholderia cepacia complex]ELW9445718.1 prepilin peptidase [Burkholderia cenocepacia]KOR20161.1 peptidase A24 [Burkholderia cenocepacia]MBR7980557.1 prepilin peptidase [Burkholderia cenocepacia]MBR7996608.1 prepilin peptidase [Burkholderia cenocepacia]MBR8409929.1 prepilin peptidase [Burkholderia cenocepacia]